jgi:hypothetical protein
MGNDNNLNVGLKDKLKSHTVDMQALATEEVNELLNKGEDFAEEFNLPMDKKAIRSREEYIRTIYNFAVSFSGHDVENHTIDLKLFEERIASNIKGWFDNTYSIEVVAPRRWRAAWYEYFLDWVKANYS